jgi:VWFA-related protein
MPRSIERQPRDHRRERRDKAGKVIPDLKKSDFTIFEDGKLQTISVFEFQKLEGDTLLPPVPASKPVARSRSPRRRAKKGRAGRAETAPPAPVIRYQDRRLVAMLFDYSTMAIPEQNRIQEAALKFIREQMKPADVVAIMYAGTGPLKIVQDFTTDKDRLEEVVKSFQIGAASELAGVAGNGGDDTTGEDDRHGIQRRRDRVQHLQYRQATCHARIRREDAGPFPEKKALLYFSSGISKSGFDNQASLEKAVNAAKRSNVYIYPIDARGLVASAPAGDASAAASRGTSALTGTQMQSQRDSFNGSQETLSTLAYDTGGKLFVDDNDLALGMEKARDDISQLLHHRLLQHQRQNGREIPPRQSQTQQRHSGEDRLPQRLFRREGVQEIHRADKEDQLAQALMLGDP